jgi:hypothetical protein
MTAPRVLLGASQPAVPIEAATPARQKAWHGLLGGWAPTPAVAAPVTAPRAAPSPQAPTRPAGWNGLLGGWAPSVKREPAPTPTPQAPAQKIAVGVPLTNPAKGRCP